ncbi:hypothetical protein CVS40_4658 [Lucilia cuprina]|nr:hypothetical protein CVS40_4658 [Lucilia cuprina]
MDDIKWKYIPYATTISNKSLNEFPNVKHFFETFVKDTDIVTKQVGRSFQHPKDIMKNQYYSIFGTFMDYFIWKYLSQQYNIEITDTFTERILENPENYVIGKNTKLRDAIEEHYEIYKDPNTRALDIIKSIKIVSLSHIIFFDEPIPKEEFTVNEDNLHELIEYFKNLPYKIIDLNPYLDCKYFNAKADIIFDNEIIYEVKTSKYKKPPLYKFYQMIIYSFSLYLKSGIKTKKIILYNPLMGTEYSMEVNNVNFKILEKVLKHDVAVYNGLQEILKDEMTLDLTLFPSEEVNVKDLF